MSKMYFVQNGINDVWVCRYDLFLPNYLILISIYQIFYKPPCFFRVRTDLENLQNLELSGNSEKSKAVKEVRKRSENFRFKDDIVLW